MEEQIKNEEEFSLMELVNSLFSKIHMLVVLLLVGCFLGGVFGYFKSYDVVYYGTNLTFFVSPEKSDDSSKGENVIYGSYGNSVMDTMIKFLGTDYAIKEYLSDMDKEKCPNLPALPDVEADDETYASQVIAYDKLIQKVKKSIAFYYKADGTVEVENSDTESKNFIYVELAVKEEGIFTKEFTGELLRQIQVKIPKIVSQTMYVPTDKTSSGGYVYITTGCTLVTPLYPMVEWMNKTYTLTETIKWSLIAGVGLFLLACVAVILVERLDQRIKDSETIERKLGIPVLGVIPNHDFGEDTENKKGGNEK